MSRGHRADRDAGRHAAGRHHPSATGGPASARITRRLLLRSGAVAMVGSAAGPGFLERTVLAAEPGREKVLVTIFLRGAMDGLMAVAPFEDEHLRRQRPRLTMSAASSAEGRLVDLDGRFGLHPSLAPLHRFWEERRLAIVHGVGSPNPTRSHFDAQDFLESGTPWRRGTPTGWLNRLAAEIGAPAPFGAVAIADRLPRSLLGSHPALAVDDLTAFDLPPRARPVDLLERWYRRGASGLLASRGRQLFETLRMLETDEQRYGGETSSTAYPASSLGKALAQVARLVKRRVGLQIAFVESAGWDTHYAQGRVSGRFASRAADLAASVAAFWHDVERYQEDVVVLTMTEFGRTVAENGSAGTDHGHGSCLFVLGNLVDGGRVYGDLPTLAPENLFEGRDLPVATDFRSVFSAVAGRLFGIADDGLLFPGWQGPRTRILW